VRSRQVPGQGSARLREGEHRHTELRRRDRAEPVGHGAANPIPALRGSDEDRETRQVAVGEVSQVEGLPVARGAEHVARVPIDLGQNACRSGARDALGAGLRLQEDPTAAARYREHRVGSQRCGSSEAEWAPEGPEREGAPALAHPRERKGGQIPRSRGEREEVEEDAV